MAFTIPRKPLAHPNYQQVALGEHWDDPDPAQRVDNAPPLHHRGGSWNQPSFNNIPNTDHEADVAGTFLVDETHSQYVATPPTLSKRGPGWNPIWLRKAFLLGLAATFLAMLAATILLFILSQSRQGLTMPDASWQYAWTYGPTSVFILSTAVWFMIDTTTRTLIPWSELLHGPSPGAKSIELDYLSPILPLAWWRAMRNRHWAVVLALTGYALLNLGTVFASGLLAVRPTTFAQPASNLVSSLRLDASDFHFDNTEHPVTAAPAVNYYGIRLLGLERPAGTMDDLVVTSLSLPDGTPAGVNYSAIIPGFLSELTCEEVPILDWKSEYLPWMGVNDIFWTTNFSLPKCYIERVIIGKVESTFYLSNTNETETYVGLSGDYICNAGMPYNGMDRVPFINSTAVHKKLLTVAHFSITGEEREKRANVTRVTAVACDQGYSINRYRTTYASRPGMSPLLQSTELLEETDELLDGYAPADAGVFTEQAIGRMQLGSGGEDFVLSQVKPMFQFMSQLAGNVTMSAFMDADLLIKHASEVTKGVSTHIAREYLMLPDDSPIAGEIMRTEDRLWAQVLSTSVLCGVLAVMAVLSVVHVFIRPHVVVTYDPNSLVSIAYTLAASPNLMKLISGMGAWRDKEIHQQVENISFNAQLLDLGQQCRSTVAIEPSSHQLAPETSASKNSIQHIKWWYPQAATIWFVSLAVIIPLAMIGALEGIQSVSDRGDGFGSLGRATAGFNVDGEMVSRYLPVLLALCVGAAYSSLEFAAQTMARYLPLRQAGGSGVAGACASRTVAFDVAGKTLPSGLYTSIKERHFGLSAIMAGAFLGHFLTIVSSGLYKVVERPQLLDVTLEQMDSFDFSISNDLLLDDNQAASITNLIEFSGLDFPQWTYEDLVFHAVSPPAVDLTLATTDDHATVQATLPAVRATLDCKAMQPSSRQLQVVDDGTRNAVMVLPGMLQSYGSTPYYALVEVNTTLPWSLCDRRLPEHPSNVSVSPWSQFFNVPISVAGTYVGMATQLAWWDDRVMGDGAIPASSFAVNTIAQQADLGCPSLAITLGSLTVTNGTRGLEIESDLGTLLCYQHVEEVSSTEVTFTLPDMNISTSTPPIPDNSTARLLPNPALGRSSTNFEFSLNHAFTALDSELGEDDALAPSIPSWNDIDQFLRLVLSRNAHDGRTAMQVLEAVAGAANTAALFDALHPFYSRYMAQAVSQNMRVAEEEESSTHVLPGTVTLPGGRRRLMQQRGPKLALQIILTVMVVAAVMMRVLMRGMRHTLPHNPLSIVGAATLLANGGWVRELARDLRADEARAGIKSVQASATEVGEKSSREARWFEDRVFSMGWWESTEGGRESVFAIESWRR